MGATWGLEVRRFSEALYRNDTEHMLSVSRAAMGPMIQALDVRIIENESVGPPPGMAEAELPPDVVGVRAGAFAWSLREEK